jgi:hypothetical protein
LWIRAKTVDQDERGNAERRALFVGLWPLMLWLIGDSLRDTELVGERLFSRVGENAALDGLRNLHVNYDPARAPEDGQPEGHWHVDSAATIIGQESPGPPEDGGVWDIACRLVSQYEFADARIVRAVYRAGDELPGRNMLLEGRFCGLRFYLGVRVTGIVDEVRRRGDGAEQVWGWCYQTLQGHLEQGRLCYEVIKNMGTGQVAFRVTGYSRQAPIPNPVIRLGFRLFGRWAQQRFYRNIQRRMYHLVRAARRDLPLPAPTVRADGIVLAPSGVRPRPLERLAPGWLHPGTLLAANPLSANPLTMGRKDDDNENDTARRT